MTNIKKKSIGLEELKYILDFIELHNINFKKYNHLYNFLYSNKQNFIVFLNERGCNFLSKKFNFVFICSNKKENKIIFDKETYDLLIIKIHNDNKNTTLNILQNNYIIKNVLKQQKSNIINKLAIGFLQLLFSLGVGYYILNVVLGIVKTNIERELKSDNYINLSTPIYDFLAPIFNSLFLSLVFLILVIFLYIYRNLFIKYKYNFVQIYGLLYFYLQLSNVFNNNMLIINNDKKEISYLNVKQVFQNAILSTYPYINKLDYSKYIRYIINNQELKTSNLYTNEKIPFFYKMIKFAQYSDNYGKVKLFDIILNDIIYYQKYFIEYSNFYIKKIEQVISIGTLIILGIIMFLTGLLLSEIIINI